MSISLTKQPKDWHEIEEYFCNYDGYPVFEEALEVHHNKTIKKSCYKINYNDVYFIAQRISTVETKHYSSSYGCIESGGIYRIIAEYEVDNEYGFSDSFSVDISQVFENPSRIYEAFKRAKHNFEIKNFLPVVTEKVFGLEG